MNNSGDRCTCSMYDVELIAGDLRMMLEIYRSASEYYLTDIIFTGGTTLLLATNKLK